MDLIQLAQWMVDHGASGVLAIVTIVQWAAIRRVYKEKERLHTLRVTDLKQSIETFHRLHGRIQEAIEKLLALHMKREEETANDNGSDCGDDGDPRGPGEEEASEPPESPDFRRRQ